MLLYILGEIKALRRRDMDSAQRYRLEKRDFREYKELRNYIVSSIVEDLGRSVVSAMHTETPGVASHASDTEDKKKRGGQMVKSLAYEMFLSGTDRTCNVPDIEENKEGGGGNMRVFTGVPF